MTRSRVKNDFAVGIDDNASSTAITIDSSENVGIGRNDPRTVLEVSGSTNRPLTVNSSNTTSVITFTDPATTSIGHVKIGSEADDMVFYAGASERLRLKSSGNIHGTGNFLKLEDVATRGFRVAVVNSTNGRSDNAINISGGDASTGEIRFGYGANNNAFVESARIRNDGGICFNGDTAAANALDDYEEGTWPVTLSDGTTTSGTLVTGRYTKIGQVVIARFDALNNINPTGFTGGNNVRISLPFTAGSTGRSTGAVITDGIDRGSRTQVNSKVSDSVAYAVIVKSGSNLNDVAVNWTDINGVSFVNDIVDFCIVYTV